MTDRTAQLVQRLWYCCNALRDDGLSYGDYVEPFYRLFLKLVDEQSRAPCQRVSVVPVGNGPL